MEKKQAKKVLENLIWERLGLHLGGFGEGFGRDLEPLGTSWGVLGAFFFMLVLRMVFKSVLEGFWAGFWFDFGGFGKNFGRV